MKKIVKNISSHKSIFIFLIFFLAILFLNLIKVYYSILSLYSYISGLFSGENLSSFVNFFFEYWAASLYLLFSIIFFVILIFKNKKTKDKKKFIFVQRAAREYSGNKYFRIALWIIYSIISIGFLAPIISPEDPYNISNISFTKYLPPLSKTRYINFIEYSFNDYSENENNNINSVLIKYKRKIQPDFSRIYFDSLNIKNEKIIFYQGAKAREFLAQNLNLETAEIKKNIFILGTDSYGRDILSRMIYGTRISLGVAFIATIVSLILGILFGLISGYYNKFIDSILMRITDVFLAFPVIFLLLIIVAFFGNSFFYLALFIGITTWMDVARLTRTQVITIKKEMFVTSLIALGLPPSRILFKHILPNIITPIIVNTIFRLGSIILMESALSFIGLGINEPIPSWGSIINNGKDNLLNAWWVSFFPGITITGVVLIFNYIGECFRKIIKIK